MLGWLSATPKGADKPRAKIMKLELPELPLDETTHFIWRDLGYSGTGPEGMALPLSWVEIAAYGGLCGREIGGIVWQVVRDMSEAYCAALNDTHPLSIAPIHRGQDG